MTASIKSKTETSVTLEITVPLAQSMLQSEENITEALNEAGCLAAEVALKQFDTDGSAIFFGAEKWTSKGTYNKTYQTRWGEASVERHVYQSSRGGRQFCPLEQQARIILTSTPGFAKLVSSKYAELGSSRVLIDLEQNHQRTIARSYLKSLCDAVGAAAQAKEESWDYALPELPAPVKSVSVGLDGTCMLLTESGWREAMVGTISLYDSQGERLHTIQIGALPEHGKARFQERLDRELALVKNQFPNACYVGLADGARDNWSFLTPRTERQTIDFWHAAGYLGQAAGALFEGKAKAMARQEWLEDACHKLKHKVGAASRLLREMERRAQSQTCSRAHRAQLEATICYFRNNKSRMGYAKNLADHLPIGSGVTEAACKTLIKQRLCNSGMRWKEQGAAAVISLRALAHTDCRWDQFWGKIDQYGFPVAA